MKISYLSTKDNNNNWGDEEVGGKARQLRNIASNMVPDWVTIVATCPDSEIERTVLEAWYSIAGNDYVYVNGVPVTNGRRYAVRSSASMEDGKDQSYAGIFESKLNVPITGLEQAVREVRGSANTARSEAYLNKMGVSHHYHNFEEKYRNDVAVIIMPMVDAKISGVLFSKEPVGGSDQMLVEWEQGVGGVVDGNNESQHAFLHRKVFPSKSIFEDMRWATDIAMQSIWAEAKRLEANYKRPVDIEWAIDKNYKPWILQVREITAMKEAV